MSQYVFLSAAGIQSVLLTFVFQTLLFYGEEFLQLHEVINVFS
jgi:hypothetical protein